MFKPAMVRAEIRLSMSEIFTRRDGGFGIHTKEGRVTCYELIKNEPALRSAHSYIRFVFLFEAESHESQAGLELAT